MRRPAAQNLTAWRGPHVLRAHNERNLAEYEGRTEIDEKLLADLIRCIKKLEAEVAKLEPPPET